MTEKIVEHEQKETKPITEKISSIGPERIKRINIEREYRHNVEDFFGFSIYHLDQLPKKSELVRNALDKNFKQIQEDLINIVKEESATDDFFEQKNGIRQWFEDGIMYEKNPEKFMSETLGMDYINSKKKIIKRQIEVDAFRKNKTLTKEEEKDLYMQRMAENAAIVFISRYVNNKKNLLTNNVLLKLIKNNIEIWKKKKVEFEKRIEGMKEKFMNEIKNNIDSGKFPLTMEYVKEIINSLEFTIVDYMNIKLREMGGDYETENHTVRISLRTPEKLQYKTFVHEVIHALSGKNELITYNSVSPLFNETEFIRLGAKLKSKLLWLNEALTEKAAIDVIGEENEYNTYKQERKILNFLLNVLEIPRDILYKAYFENYDPKKESHKQPNLKELFNFTNKKFGNKFLMNLDEFISYNQNKLGKEKGLNKVLEVMNEQDKNFPEYLANVL